VPSEALALERIALALRQADGEPWQGASAVPASGGQARLTLTLRNRGTLPLHRLAGRIEGDTLAGKAVEFPIGRLAAGATIAAPIVLPLPTRLAAGAHPFTLVVQDGRGARQLDATLLLPLRPRPHPRIGLELTLYEDGSAGSRGNGDGRAQPGETLALRVRLTNEGPGHLGEGRVWLHGEGASGLDLLEAWDGIAALPAGGTGIAHLRFTLPAQAPPRSQELTVNLIGDGNDGSPDLELSGNFSLVPGRALPTATLRAPRLALETPPLRQHAPRLRIVGSVGDDEGVQEVQGYLNGHKVFYLAGRDSGQGALPRSLPVAVEVALAPGGNLLEVVARDAPGLRTSQAYRIWRDDGRAVMMPGAGAAYP
jgi:hypothetical protein